MKEKLRIVRGRSGLPCLSQLSTFCRQLKLTAADGKQYASDCLTQKGIDNVLLVLPGKYRVDFSDWVVGMASPQDERSKQRAYELWDSPILDDDLVGSIEGLRQVHAFLFAGLYDFAGQIRTKNISKGGFQFANCAFFGEILPSIEALPDSTAEQIVDKYVEMNIAHPFMEGNGRGLLSRWSFLFSGAKMEQGKIGEMLPMDFDPRKCH